MQGTTNSLQPKKDKWTHYAKKDKIIVDHTDKETAKSAFSWFIIVSTSMWKHLLK